MMQAQLQVGSVDDPLEHEADSIAERVTSSPALGNSSAAATPRISRKCMACERGGNLQKQSAGVDSGSEAPGLAHEVLRSPGQPLDAATRMFMEPRFGREFSQVRVHNSSAAEQSAQALNANAYTVGQNIVFGAGKFAPGTPGGNRLIAHELTHVVQQSESGSSQARIAQRDAKKGTPPAVTPVPAKPAGQQMSGEVSRASDDRTQLDQFWSSMAQVGAKERAKKLVDDAVQRMMADRGPEIQELTVGIDNYKNTFQTKEDWDIHLALIEKRKKIFDEYDPSVQRSSQGPYLPSPLMPNLPYSTVRVPLYGPHPLSPLAMDPLQNAVYAPDIVPDHPVPYGPYGGSVFDHVAVRSSVNDAYAYNIQTDATQVANDIERIARTGVVELHVATGTHGTPVGGMVPEVLFLQQDQLSIADTMQRHPGLHITYYDMADPAQVATFDGLQALAAEGKLPGGATIAAFCYSRTRVLDPNPDPIGPYASVELLDNRPPLRVSFTQGGFTALFGAMTIYGGLNDPNTTVGGLKVAAGGAQVMGGASYAAGNALDSVGLVRWGSRLGEFGGYAGAALAMYDFVRGMSSKFQPGGSLPVSGEEALADSTEDTLKLAGIFFPEAAVAAVGLEYGVKPLAGKVANYITPTFMGAMAEIYPYWRHF